MPGPIGLLGGLEHYESTLPLDRLLLEQVGAPAPRVAVLPLASFRRQVVAAGELARQHWTGLGTRVEVVIPASGDDRQANEMVAAADVIVLPGGVPDRLVTALAGTALWDEVVSRWSTGAGVTGSSAGAMDLFRQRIRLYPPNPFRLIPGLGLLDGFVAAPHFDRFRGARWLGPIVRRLDGVGVIGLDESTGIVGRDGSMQVLGTGSVTIAQRDEVTVHPSGSIIDNLFITSAQVDGEATKPVAAAA